MIACSPRRESQIDMGSKGTISVVRLLVVFCLLQLATASAQQLPAPAKPPIPQPTASPIQPSATGQSGQEDTQTKPLYGTQGVLVETLDGRIVASQNADELFNPASSVKLATALVALRTLGPQHRFTTGVWTDGTLDKTSGTLSGNLYVSGRDPSLHYEQAVDIARQLNSIGIRKVTGDLVVAPSFTLNFNWSARRSGEQLYDTLDSELRSSEATNAWFSVRSTLGDKSVPAVIPSVAVMGEVVVNPVAAQARLLLSYSSSKLTDILKVLLCYSNNFMAERLGEILGGAESVQRQLVVALAVQSDQIRLASLSGLGVNRMSPQTMMKILRFLRQELTKNGLSLSDILPVAGVDPGTLEDRFTASPWRGSVIAKTGTLARTDGGASSLVGQMRTMSGEVLLFAIMNQNGSVARFRENQDSLVMQIQSSRGGPRAFDYVPLTLSIKLSDTKSRFGSSEEYEPKTTVTSSP
ncbi:MAG TPA: D-alanyl-D-alanine carboxypeptidase [Pyrinomonadaceae bacterium]|nr:D-alanyl-D-alanine carboxypeptidase [Pyrinomonadaceae bacterium]